MKKFRFLPLKLVCRIASPIFSGAFYVFIVLIAVMVIAIPIIALAGVSAEEMLLPPFMHMENTGDVKGYLISLGNGLSMFAPQEAVTASDIKTSLYLAIMLASATLAALIPICRFLGRLCANVRDEKLFEPKNADYINYTGIAVIVGETVVSFITRFYNYRLVILFAASPENVSFAPGISVRGIFVGLFILLLGSIYGCACRMHGETAPTQTSDNSD